MPTSTTFLRCDNCDGGKVKRTVKATNTSLDIKVGDCDKCGKSYGIKSSSVLAEVSESK